MTDTLRSLSIFINETFISTIFNDIVCTQFNNFLDNKHEGFCEEILSNEKLQFIKKTLIEKTMPSSTEEDEEEYNDELDKYLIRLFEELGCKFIIKTTEEECDVMFSMHSNYLICPKYIDKRGVIMAFVAAIAFSDLI